MRAAVVLSVMALAIAGCMPSAQEERQGAQLTSPYRCLPGGLALLWCDGSVGWACSGGDVPTNVEPQLSCSSGVPLDDGNGTVVYCCNNSGTQQTEGGAPACAVDSTVPCPTAATGYTCTGYLTPRAAMPSLVCDEGDFEASVGHYCCSAPDAGQACIPDPLVACRGDAVGYACNGEVAPNAFNSTLACSQTTAAGGELLYCCSYSVPDGTCVEELTLACDGGVGYACGGDASPPAEGGTCLPGTPQNGGTTPYCCP
jgi:hypothetical protein